MFVYLCFCAKIVVVFCIRISQDALLCAIINKNCVKIKEISKLKMSSTSGSTRNFIPMQNKYDRVVLLVDMDCFYCQVEEKLNPEIKGKPVAVVQYNAWRGGGIIAVNYAARAKGVTRHIRGDEAKVLCPDIVLVKVPNIREKADLSKYRDAGKEVANVLQRYTSLLERASVDEAYLDITDSVNKRMEDMNTGNFVLRPEELVNTYAVGYANIGEYVNKITKRFANPYMDEELFQRAHDQNDLPAVRQSDLRLLIGASIAGEIRTSVKSVTGYECSAGIAHNKILAKLACGMNKPNKQTILPLAEIPGLFETLPVGKIKGLGGKYGEEVCEHLKIKFIGQLLKFTEYELQRKFDEKNGSWLYNISRGVDLEAVTPRFYSKSIGCCKKFPGRNNITGLKTLQHWLNELATEINDRLEKDAIENNRKAKQMVVSFIQEFDGEEISSSRSAPLTHYDLDTLAKYALEVIKTNTKLFLKPGSEAALNNPIKFLGISVGKFETVSNGQSKLQEMFANQATKKRKISVDTESPTVTKIEKAELPEPLNETAKPTEEQKMKSFFSNYLQTAQNTNVGRENDKAKNVEEDTPQFKEATKSKEIKSFFLNAFKKQQEIIAPLVESKQETKNLLETKINTEGKSLFSKAINKQAADIPQQHETDHANVDVIHSKLNDRSDKSLHSSNKTELQRRPAVPDAEAASKSFFLKAFKEQSKSQKQNETSLSKVNAEIENQQLAQELEEMENSIEKESNLLCSETLSMLSDSQSNFVSTEANTSPEPPTKRKFNEINKTPAKQDRTNDYKSTYAEYALPVVSTELLKFIKCDQCGESIPDDSLSLQTHQDHHFAQQLSQQQRMEFRTGIQKAKASESKSPPDKANKKSKKPSINTTIITPATPSGGSAGNFDITKFLIVKPTQTANVLPTLEEPSTSAAAAQATEPMELCSECKSYIKITELTEHMDFHMAKQLQRKLNQLEVRTVTVVKKSSSTKKQQLNKTALDASHRSSNKSITQFFSQRN